MDSSTTFKLTLTREGVGTPNTGLFTGTSSAASIENNIVAIVLTVMSVALVVAMIVGIVAYIKRKQAGFSISSRATAMFRMFMTFAIVASAGCAGGAIFAVNNGVYAEEGIAEVQEEQTPAPTESEITPDDGPGGTAPVESNAPTSNVPSTTRVETEGGVLLRDSEEEVEAEDIIKVTNATPAGYKIYMQVDSVALKNEGSDAKIDPISEATEEIPTGKWGYKVEHASKYSVPKTDLVEIASVTGATEAGDATSVRFKAKVAANQDLGTYKTNAKYVVIANEVNYVLQYDVNNANGSFAQNPGMITSPATIAPSYEFTITDKTPTTTTAGLNFYGWSLTGDSLSDIYTAGQKYVATSTSTTLKAVWGYKKYTITYNKNMDASVAINNFIPSQICIVTTSNGTTCQAKITERIPNADGYSLLGWSKTPYAIHEGDTIDTARSKVDYLPGANIDLTGDTTLYAVWWNVNQNDWQIELRWGAEPKDVDSFLVVVDRTAHTSVDKVYYHNKKVEIDNGSVKLEAALDIDDTDRYGPETVTINMLPLSAYDKYDFYYSIYDFTNDEEPEQSPLKTSGAKITVFRRGSSQERTFEIKDAIGDRGNLWNVFVIRNNQIIVKNTMQSITSFDQADINY